jgi:hypothetical protein
MLKGSQQRHCLGPGDVEISPNANAHEREYHDMPDRSSGSMLNI